MTCNTFQHPKEPEDRLAPLMLARFRDKRVAIYSRIKSVACSFQRFHAVSGLNDGKRLHDLLPLPSCPAAIGMDLTAQQHLAAGEK